jgi:hypothetical protein
MSSDDHITVRDWRRQPPLRLRVTKKLDIHWCWIKCTRCPHMRAVAIAPYIIRWGPDGWRDMLRRAGCCTKCGKKGVQLQHPSWDGSDTGWAAMPVTQMARVPPA